MIDIHCHILPGLDDGSDNLEESVEMAKLAQKSGTNVIVATPHTNVPNSYQNYISKDITDRYNLLRKTLKERGIDVSVVLGQEIFCFGRIVDLFRENKLITLNQSRYPLIEFDFNIYSDYVYSNVEMLLAGGYVPVIAHPERYAFIKEDEDAVYRLKNMGCLIQINKGSVLGGFGRNAKIVSERLLEERLADIVASDAHSPYMRTTYMGDVHEFICENFSADYADYLFEKNPDAVLKNKKVYSF